MLSKMSSFTLMLVLATVCGISGLENTTEEIHSSNDYHVSEEEDNSVNGSQIAEATANDPATPIPAVTLTACELTTQRRLTVIKSSAFPNPYNPNIDCKYVIKRQSENTCSVTFLFNVFDLQRSENCDKDYLSIEGERICGSQPIGFT
ncbi:uncharacterized protein LOC111615246, partial [Centruroides sculpturatus]|uniref:uncharacterized protein LOC111615246 n=1 Tax=Centruroides sculpturatus TaxID=218467 RepID=UPI000C6DDF22